MANKKASTGQVKAGSDDNNVISTIDYNTFASKQKAEFKQLFEESKEVADAGFSSSNSLVTGDGRNRAFIFLLYPDSMNPDTLSIINDMHVPCAISPLHDRDFFADGTKKKPHFHVIMYFEGKKSLSQVEKWVHDTLGGVGVQVCQSIIGATRYLCHLDIDPENNPADKGKVRYSQDDIVEFAGFDASAKIKATTSQKTKAIKEMIGIIRDNGICNLADFMDAIYSNYPEYEMFICDSRVNQVMRDYVKNNYLRQGYFDNKKLREKRDKRDKRDKQGSDKHEQQEGRGNE